MTPPRYTSRSRKAVVAKAVHKWNKERFDPGEGLAFDALTEQTQPVTTCETCGKPLELDLWQNLVCGYCLGWRVSKP
jgi:hypothetical protein